MAMDMAGAQPPAAGSRLRTAPSAPMATENWPARFRPVLAKLAANGQHYFGSQLLGIEALREIDRPFSMILQIRVTSAAGVENAFVKILKPRADTPEEIESMRRNVGRDFEMTSRVDRGLAPYPGLTAVRPIACFPEELAIVTAEAGGQTLADLLGRAAGWPGGRTIEALIAAVRQAGAWVKAVQTALPQDGDVTLDSVRTYFERRLNELEADGPVRLTRDGRKTVETHRESLIDQALAAQAGRDGFPRVWIHADFCPENVVVRNGRLTVLDFTMAKTGTVYHDISHLHLRMESMQAKPWFRSRIISRLQRQLLDSFEPGLTTERPLFRLMLLQHVLCHLLEIRTAMRQPLTRLYAARLHARHQRWLAAEAGLHESQWVR